MPKRRFEREYGELVKRVLIPSLLGLSLLVCSSAHCQVRDAKREGTDPIDAQTVTYCAILNHPEAFKDKLIRVRALYETDFEVAAITSPVCSNSIPMTWIEFEEDWERRTDGEKGGMKKEREGCVYRASLRRKSRAAAGRRNRPALIEPNSRLTPHMHFCCHSVVERRYTTGTPVEQMEIVL